VREQSEIGAVGANDRDCASFERGRHQAEGEPPAIGRPGGHACALRRLDVRRHEDSSCTDAELDQLERRTDGHCDGVTRPGREQTGTVVADRPGGCGDAHGFSVSPVGEGEPARVVRRKLGARRGRSSRRRCRHRVVGEDVVDRPGEDVGDRQHGDAFRLRQRSRAVRGCKERTPGPSSFCPRRARPG
jgi:hypothetical protein